MAKDIKDISGKIAGAGKSFFDFLKAEGSKKGGGTAKSDKLTNKVLYEELVQHFVCELDELSVGERMLYPMAFNVLMHPDDYGPREESLPFVLPEVVSRFYKIIESRRAEYANFIPAAKYWFFQFSACELKQVEGKHGGERIIEKGRISTVASLMALDMSANTTMETNTRFSLKPQNSDPSGNNNINMEAIRNLDFKGSSAFTFTFDKELKASSENIIASSNLGNVTGLATLTYSLGANNIHYDMRDNLVHISGSGDTRTARTVFKLQNDQIQDSHVQIRYSPAENKFQIAAFGQTRLNGRLLELSEGGTISWSNLPNDSQIFMNGVIAVNFKINR